MRICMLAGNAGVFCISSLCCQGALMNTGRFFRCSVVVGFLSIGCVAQETPSYTDSGSGWSLTATDPIGVGVTTSYDGLGRATQVQNNNSGVIVSTQYDWANRPTFTSNPNFSLSSTGTHFAAEPIR